jgi:formylglycine-generating enzyme
MTRRTSLLLLPALAALTSFALLSAAPAPVFRSKAPPKTISNSIGMKLMRIPEGKFLMGSPEGEKGRGDHEGPEHEVRIAKAFYLGACEVTQGEYEKVMGTNPSRFSATGGGKDKVKGLKTTRFPVECVSYEDAVKFCKKLSATKGERAGKYRLPTEAEWEYACRGGAKGKTPFHFGNSLSSHQANFDGTRPRGDAAKGPSLERTCAVGSFQPNGYGLFDMHGNVDEWCQDWYGEKYYANSPADDPPGPSEGKYRVYRGGSWTDGGESCSSANRNGREKVGNDYLGFRVVLVPFE